MESNILSNSTDVETCHEISKTSDVPETDITLKQFFADTSKIALPGILFYASIVMLQFTNLLFIGKYYDNTDMLNGIGISNLYMNCTLFAIMQGLVSGLEPLCSNALGQKKYKLIGIYKHRASIIGYSAVTIIVIIHFFTARHFIRIFDISEEGFNYAERYFYVCLIYVFFDVQSSVNIRFLNVIGKPHISFFISLGGCLLHPLWDYIFIGILDLDVLGAGIAFIISRFIIFLATTLYINIANPLPESNFWINKYL